MLDSCPSFLLSFGSLCIPYVHNMTCMYWYTYTFRVVHSEDGNYSVRRFGGRSVETKVQGWKRYGRFVSP